MKRAGVLLRLLLVGAACCSLLLAVSEAEAARRLRTPSIVATPSPLASPTETEPPDGPTPGSDGNGANPWLVRISETLMAAGLAFGGTRLIERNREQKHERDFVRKRNIRLIEQLEKFAEVYRKAVLRAGREETTYDELFGLAASFQSLTWTVPDLSDDILEVVGGATASFERIAGGADRTGEMNFVLSELNRVIIEVGTVSGLVTPSRKSA